ncbi:MAG: aspartyl protease family protein [Verrucomicrobia bacterium]|nr:aspartyl protease family protein [Verrucomicrobiota bacterium]
MLTFSLRDALAETQFRPGLEKYLKHLGYEALVLTREQETKQLLIHGELNGTERVCWVDTGCSVTCVDKSAAKKLKSLGELGAELEDSFLGTVNRSNIVVIDHLKLGAAQFLNQPARVKTLDFGGHGSLASVMIGADFLFRNFCLLDCRDGRLYVRGSALPEPSQKALDESLRRFGLQPVNLEFKPGLVMTCAAKANGEPMKLLVDTGATWSMVDKHQVQRLHLQPSVTAWEVAGLGKIGKHRVSVTRLKSLELGEIKAMRAEFGVAEMGDWGIAGPKGELQDVDGVMGLDQLVLNSAFIDCRSLKLWLKPLKLAK